MRVIYQQQGQQTVREQTTARLPVRGNLIAPDGTVIRIPIDPANPDAWTIISALQFVIEQYGRLPAVRAAAIRQIQSKINNDVANNARTIARWVMNSMIYLADPDGAEFVQTPLVLLKQIDLKGRAYGDCDDHVVLLGSMLNAIGIPAQAVGVKLHGAPYYNHVVIQYPLNGQMVTIDPCAKVAAAPFYGERLTVR
jgi:hypothetical protein